MDLHQIPIENLSVSSNNMRKSRSKPEVGDLLPSIREKGVLTPLIVRTSKDEHKYEIVAGQRRFHASKTLGDITSLPCIVLAGAEDAHALEVSLIENLARRDPEPMSEYEAFAKLVRKGRTVAEIAALFGLDERRVGQRLALGNLLPDIRQAYRDGKIDPASMQALTLATRAQQRDWLTLFADAEQHAPTGQRLKQWLFGGQSISTDVALFDAEAYPGKIVADLFGELAYFDDSEAFWTLQTKAVEAMTKTLTEDGWLAVEVFDTSEALQIWNYVKCTKVDGGHVLIDVARNGEVTIHEGYLSQRDAERRAKAKEDGTESPAPKRRELTNKLENYCALHRQAMVRAALTKAPQLALRLLATHLLVGSSHWSVSADPQRAACGDTAVSVAASKAENAFETERSSVCERLGIPFDANPLVQPYGNDETFALTFARLIALSDEAIVSILTFLIAESLAAGGIGVELAGQMLDIDPDIAWQPDDAYFALLRDKAAINAMLAETRGDDIAKVNRDQTRNQQVEALRTGIASHTEAWRPGYMAFPFQAYTDKSGGRLEELGTIATDALNAKTADAENA